MNIKIRKVVAWSAFFSGMALFTMPILFSMAGFDKLNKLFISNNNILLMVFTACLVITLDRIKFVNKYINYMTSSTIAIYLITDNAVTRTSLDKWLLQEVLDGATGFVYILIVAFLCIVIDKIRVNLFNMLNVIFKMFKLKIDSLI